MRHPVALTPRAMSSQTSKQRPRTATLNRLRVPSCPRNWAVLLLTCDVYLPLLISPKYPELSIWLSTEFKIKVASCVISLYHLTVWLLVVFEPNIMSRKESVEKDTRGEKELWFTEQCK